MAKNIMNHLKTALKVVAIGGLSGTILGYGYLQYISSVIGPISLNREQAISFYQDKYQYSDTKAKMTYYFALWNLSVSRILEYHSYVGYCDRLNRKIISYSLENYQNAKIQQQIEKAGSVNKNKGLHQKIYMKIQPVRRKNAQNIADRQFIIKRIMQYQRQLNTSVLPNIPIQKLNRVEKIYRYLIDVGLTQQKPQIQAKFSKLLDYEKKHPKDTIHKILLI